MTVESNHEKRTGRGERELKGLLSIRLRLLGMKGSLPGLDHGRSAAVATLLHQIDRTGSLLIGGIVKLHSMRLAYATLQATINSSSFAPSLFP